MLGLSMQLPMPSLNTLAIVIEWLRHAADPSIAEAGGTPISPDLASGGPSRPRDRLESTPNHGWKLGEFLTAPGDHSGPISDTFPQFWAMPAT